MRSDILQWKWKMAALSLDAPNAGVIYDGTIKYHKLQNIDQPFEN